MDHGTDPPPIYHQIPPPKKNRQKGRNKGTFTKVTTSASAQRTTNFRIRKLADGRLGQHRIDRVLIRDDVRGNDGVPNDSVGTAEPHNVVDNIPADKPSLKKKDKRKAKSDTWAVCFCSLLSHRFALTWSVHTGPHASVLTIPRAVFG